MEYNSFITNFQSPQDLDEMEYLQSQGVGSNLDILLKEYKSGTDWTVPSDAYSILYVREVFYRLSSYGRDSQTSQGIG